MCGLPTTAADSSAASDRRKCIQTKPLILPPRGPVWGSSGAVSGRSRDHFEGLVSYESCEVGGASEKCALFLKCSLFARFLRFGPIARLRTGPIKLVVLRRPNERSPALAPGP